MMAVLVRQSVSEALPRRLDDEGNIFGGIPAKWLRAAIAGEAIGCWAL